MSVEQLSIDLLEAQKKSNNYSESLDEVFEVLGDITHSQFEAMSDEERNAFIRDIKINTILKHE